MKRTVIIALAVCTSAVAVESFAAEADDAIKPVFAELDRCIENTDAQCVGDLMVEDATFASPGEAKIVKGKAQIVKAFGEMLGGSMKGAKQTHTVDSVRLIDEDHAVVDAAVAVAGTKPAGDTGAEAPRGYHAVAVMVLREGKWLFQDLRSYVVDPPKK